MGLEKNDRLGTMHTSDHRGCLYFLQSKIHSASTTLLHERDDAGDPADIIYLKTLNVRCTDQQ